ncbi:hypothetical protein E2C01_039268 [Portunus trituberculatus]|uniref:Uncharacterized protein n=1 Tax=Portunus trituberculatus TaxID=210409 RepID=A0A5B7FJ85_PORTR|nr:hypothetical protein [Portunus trituberculatus]
MFVIKRRNLLLACERRADAPHSLLFVSLGGARRRGPKPCSRCGGLVITFVALRSKLPPIRSSIPPSLLHAAVRFSLLLLLAVCGRWQGGREERVHTVAGMGAAEAALRGKYNNRECHGEAAWLVNQGTEH